VFPFDGEVGQRDAAVGDPDAPPVDPSQPVIESIVIAPRSPPIGGATDQKIVVTVTGIPDRTVFVSLDPSIGSVEDRRRAIELGSQGRATVDFDWETPATFGAGTITAIVSYEEELEPSNEDVAHFELVQQFGVTDASGQQTVPQNALLAYPFTLPMEGSVRSFTIRTVAATSSTVRFGIYDDDQGRPGSKQFEASGLNLATETTVAGFAPVGLQGPAVYWIALHVSGAELDILGTFNGGGAQTVYRANHVGETLPVEFPTTASTNAGSPGYFVTVGP
jgi:hypothetical protein